MVRVWSACGGLPARAYTISASFGSPPGGRTESMAHPRHGAPPRLLLAATLCQGMSSRDDGSGVVEHPCTGYTLSGRNGVAGWDLFHAMAMAIDVERSFDGSSGPVGVDHAWLGVDDGFRQWATEST